MKLTKSLTVLILFFIGFYVLTGKVNAVCTDGPVDACGTKDCKCDEGLFGWCSTNGGPWVPMCVSNKSGSKCNTCTSSCSCSGWDDDECGGGSCSNAEMNQTRDCTPDRCRSESRCVEDSSCTSSSCSCSGWDDDECGGGSCSGTEMRQTRDCTPDRCRSESRCVEDSSCSSTSTPTTSPTPECDANLSLIPSVEQFIDIGEEVDYEAIVTNVTPGCTHGRVNFRSLDEDVFTVAPDDDDLEPYLVTATGVGVGRDQVRAFIRMSDGTVINDREWITVNAAPSCDISVGNITLSGVGDTGSRNVSIDDESNGVISNVLFSVDDPSIASITSTNPDTSPAFRVTFRSEAVGETGYTALATMDDGTTTCSDGGRVTVELPQSWLQVKHGNAIVGSSSVSSNITIPVLSGSYLMDFDTSYPGIPIYSGSISTTPGGISDGFGWRVRTGYAGDIPTYLGLRSKVPSSITLPNLGGTATANESMLRTSGQEYPAGSGYYYFANSGTLTLEDGDGTIDLGNRRIVIFNAGNVNINSKINLNNGQGFLMIIASGNINISKDVGGTDDSVPEIKGVFYTDGSFNTGSEGEGLGADEQLHIRGVVVADTVNPERNFAQTDPPPAEIFEFAPDQSMLIPPIFSKRAIEWKEVLP